MALMGFEPIISAGERPQTYTLYSAATGIGHHYNYTNKKYQSTVLFVGRHHSLPLINLLYISVHLAIIKDFAITE